MRLENKIGGAAAVHLRDNHRNGNEETRVRRYKL